MAEEPVLVAGAEVVCAISEAAVVEEAEVEPQPVCYMCTRPAVVQPLVVLQPAVARQQLVVVLQPRFPFLAVRPLPPLWRLSAQRKTRRLRDGVWPAPVSIMRLLKPML